MIATEKSKIVEDCLKHNIFPWSKQSGLNPMEIDHAEGSYFYTKEGEKYLDFSSQLVNMNFGHGHPKMKEAIVEQMEKFSFILPGAATEIKAKVSKKLASISPGNLNKVFYTVSGAEANENAIKIARLYTGKHKILAHYRSYHGATYGSMSAGGDPRRLPIDSNQMPNVVHFENPYSYRCPWGSDSEDRTCEMALANLERTIQYQGPNNIAAILIEGESGTSGCIKYPKGYWKGLIQIAKKHGILTISDEVISGFGRTGEWFGVSHHGVEPDMITCAKGLTGGYLPLGAVIVQEEIISFFKDKALPIGLTNNSQPLCLAAAHAALTIYEEEGLLERAQSSGKYLEYRLKEMQENHPSLGDIRITGMLCCLELVKNKSTKEALAPFNATADQMEAMNLVASEIKKHKVFTLTRWNWIFITPPLNMTKEQIDEGLIAIEAALTIADGFCE